MSDDIYSLNQGDTIRMCSLPVTQWSPYEEKLYERHVEGIFALLVSLQTTTHGFLPYVRFARTSTLSQRIAKDLCAKFEKERCLFDAPNTTWRSLIL